MRGQGTKRRFIFYSNTSFTPLELRCVKKEVNTDDTEDMERFSCRSPVEKIRHGVPLPVTSGAEFIRS